MKETIAEMLKVEAQAKEIVSAAESEAAELIQKARAEAQSFEENAQAQTKAEAARLIKSGADQARTERQQALEQIDKDNEHLHQIPGEKAVAAQGMILSAVTGMTQ